MHERANREAEKKHPDPDEFFLTGARALLPSTHPASLKGRLHAVTDAGRVAVAMRRAE